MYVYICKMGVLWPNRRNNQQTKLQRTEKPYLYTAHKHIHCIIYIYMYIYVFVSNSVDYEYMLMYMFAILYVYKCTYVNLMNY